MQSSSEQPLVGEERYVTTLITAAKETMLPCVCSVIDHRGRQNVVRTKKWDTRRSRLCH